MTGFLYFVVEIIYMFHEKLLGINDAFEYTFSDKELHFIVIAIIGMLLLFVIYPLFKALSRKHVMVIAWIYVFTVMIVLTFAIEIGQKITNTGNMEFADIMFGLVGFLAAFFVFCIIRGIYHLIRKYLIKKEIITVEAEEE